MTPLLRIAIAATIVTVIVEIYGYLLRKDKGKK